MLKEKVWQCDVCGRVVASDGYPKDWYSVEIIKGSFWHRNEGEDTLLDTDCCCLVCLDKALYDFLESLRGGQ